MSKPCKYCGVERPLGVDKETRFVPFRKSPSPDIETTRGALLAENARLRARRKKRREPDTHPVEDA